MKKAKREAKKRTPRNAQPAEQRPSGEDAGGPPKKDRVMALVSLLISAERAGNIRGFLQCAVSSIRKLELESDDWKSPAARGVNENREAVALYLHSLLSHLDAGTKREVATDLISDLWMSASHDSIRHAAEHALTVEPQRDAALAMMAIMREATTAYCNIAGQGDPEVAGELPLLAAQLVECLQGIARSRPELVRSVAGERATWPIMAAKNFPKASDFAKLAERIGLAADCTVSPHKAQKWKPDTPINVFLLSLLADLSSQKRSVTGGWLVRIGRS